jgi:integrase
MRPPGSDASRTVNRELEALAFAFNLAIKDGVLHAKPHVPALAEDNVRTGFFEREEFEAVVKHIGKVDRRGRVRFENVQDVIRFGYMTGWRLGEVLGLQWKNVDFKAGEVRLDPGTTKNGEGRVFPMTPDLRALLERRRKTQPTIRGYQPRVVSIKKSDYVFTTKKGDRIGSFRKRWNKACAAAGVPGRLFHDLRRCAVRNLVRAGVSRSVAMRLTGHKTESVFERYNITSIEDLRDAVKRLEAAR